MAAHPQTGEQLVLNVGLRDGAVFDAFMAEGNAPLVATLKRMAEGAGDEQVFIHGATASGKTHLLQAACHAAHAAGLTAAYLPLAELAAAGPPILVDLESVALVCLDDLDRVLGQPEWERGVFNLINGARAEGHRLVMAAALGPAEWGVELPDLASRLQWGGVYRLQPLNDAQKLEALVLRARRRGFELSEEAARYLLNNCPRDLSSLLEVLDRLDEATLAQQRRVTIPFIKALLGL